MASEEFRELQEVLARLEMEIARMRLLYNDQAKLMNDLVQRFPSCLVARLFRFKRAGYLKLS